MHSMVEGHARSNADGGCSFPSVSPMGCHLPGPGRNCWAAIKLRFPQPNHPALQSRARIVAPTRGHA